MLNVHPSLLPRWRGAAPIERAIMAGDARTGVCVMRLTAGLDSGPGRPARGGARSAPTTTSRRSPRRLAALGGELLVQRPRPARPRARSSSPSRTRRRRPTPRRSSPPSAGSTPRARPPSWPRTVRALTPHIGAYLETAGGERLGVRRARAVDVSVKTGELKAEWGALLLGCGRGALRLEVVQPPGGKPMPVDAYLRGHSLPKL